jgi:putative methionine-R-sulfoxide reductase with GAF domain
MNLKIEKTSIKLGLSYVAIVAVIIGAGVFTIKQTRELADLSEKLYIHTVLISNSVRDIQTHIIAMHRGMKDVALAVDMEQMEQAKAVVDMYEQEIIASFRVLDKRFLGDKARIDKTLITFKGWKSIRKEVISFMEVGKRDEAAAITKGKGADYVKGLDDEIKYLTTFINDKSIEFRKSVKKKVSSVFIWGIVITIVSCVIALFIAVLLGRIISTPLKIATAKMGLSDCMRGEQDLLTLGKNTVSFLSKYLGAQMASLYLVDESGESLALSGSYSFNKRKCPNERIKMGEGLAGQAALEKSILSVNDVPGDYLKISSTLGDAAPCNIFVMPLIYEDKLVGVVEFASFKKFTETKMDFWDNVSESVAIAFYSAQSRRKMLGLFEESQQQSEELEAQAEELQSQQGKLEISNEELEQQSEELRTSNEELEEKTEALERQKAEIERRKG